MRTSRKWLSQYMDLSDLSLEELAEKITNAGLEVEAAYPLSSGTNLVIGQIVECEMHPDSDHLHITKVDLGDEIVQIVCGAPNVAEGQKSSSPNLAPSCQEEKSKRSDPRPRIQWYDLRTFRTWR